MIDGAFLHHSSLFCQKQECYSSLFYQKVVSLHIDMLFFFSDLNKIISWKPLIFENRKKDRYKCLQSRFWIFIHLSLSFCIFIRFFAWTRHVRTRKEHALKGSLKGSLKSSLKGSLSAFWKLIESSLKAFWKLLKSPCRPLSLKNMLFFVYPTNCCISAIYIRLLVKQLFSFAKIQQFVGYTKKRVAWQANVCILQK